MRRNIVAGNWKMNMTKDEALKLTEEIVIRSSRMGVELILAPPFVYIDLVQSIVSDLSHVTVSAQNMHQELSGAYTGEVSATMIHSLGAGYVILGHSERRQYYNETDDLILEKMRLALSQGISPIYCCGEQLTDRKSGNFKQIVEQQMHDSVLQLTKIDLSNTIVAYEPVWAIGTGETASPEQAQEMHEHIRALLSEHCGTDDVPILYGGSVKPDNAKELFGQKDVDGGLVGGASLDAESFIDIVSGFEHL